MIPYGVWMLIGIVLLFGLLVWIALWFLKKKRRIEKAIRTPPEDILNDFNNAEEELKGGTDNYLSNNDNGTNTKDPYEILYELRKRRGNEEADRNIKSTEQAEHDRQLSNKLNRRQELQVRTTPSINKDTDESGRTEGSNREVSKSNAKSFINRIRRK